MITSTAFGMRQVSTFTQIDRFFNDVAIQVQAAKKQKCCVVFVSYRNGGRLVVTVFESKKDQAEFNLRRLDHTGAFFHAPKALVSRILDVQPAEARN